MKIHPVAADVFQADR